MRTRTPPRMFLKIHNENSQIDIKSILLLTRRRLLTTNFALISIDSISLEPKSTQISHKDIYSALNNDTLCFDSENRNYHEIKLKMQLNSEVCF